MDRLEVARRIGEYRKNHKCDRFTVHDVFASHECVREILEDLAADHGFMYKYDVNGGIIDFQSENDK